MKYWWIKKLWRNALSYLDETGFGESARETFGQVWAQLSVKTGRKGINAGHLAWFTMVILAITTKSWLISLLTVVITAAVILPVVTRITRSLASPLLFKPRKILAGSGPTTARRWKIRLFRH